MKTVIIFGTFDSKGEEFEYLAKRLAALDTRALRVDLSMKADADVKGGVTAAEVARAAGVDDLAEMRSTLNRDECLAAMAKGAAKLIKELVENGTADGVMSLGGGQGSIMAGMVMRELPVGLPKLIVSTMATVPFAQRSFNGVNDTFIINPLVDVAGLNPILRSVIDKAAAAMAGMVASGCSLEFTKDKKRVGITMWGVTTPCVDKVREKLEREGCEVYVFHANGMGGRTFEKLITQGFFDAVADLTVSEITQPLSCGGDMDNVKLRMTSAALAGVPQVVSVGGADMVNCPPNDIPADRAERKRYYHTPVSLFVRSSPEENMRFAEVIADKLNAAKGRVTLLLPLGGTSSVNVKGGPLYEPETDRALFDELKKRVNDNVRVLEIDANINDERFAGEVAAQLIEYLK